MNTLGVILLMEVIDKITLNDIIGHVYFLTIYGVFVYYAILFRIWKTRNKKGRLKEWFITAMPGFIATLIVAPLVVIMDEEIVYLLNRWFKWELTFGAWIYVMSGPLTDLFTRGVLKLSS